MKLINLRNDDAIAAVAKVSSAKEEEAEGEKQGEDTEDVTE